MSTSVAEAENGDSAKVAAEDNKTDNICKYYIISSLVYCVFYYISQSGTYGYSVLATALT
jgi:hypothetical protein